MIPYSSIEEQLIARLDAEGSEHYTAEQDFIPNINGATDRIMLFVNRWLGEGKISEELLRFLTHKRIWQPSTYGRIAFDQGQMGHKLASIISITCDPVVMGSDPDNAGSFLTGTDILKLNFNQPFVSRLRTELSFVSGTKLAKRLSAEQYDDNKSSEFRAGNKKITNTHLITYAYRNPISYASTSYPVTTLESEISPTPPHYVAVEYVKRPTHIQNITDSVELPESFQELLVNMTLSLISTKQADGTNLYGISERQSQELLEMIRV